MNNTYTLITGASSGIGKELARITARHEHNLIIVARNSSALQDLSEELAHVKVVAITADLSIPGSALELYSNIEERGIEVDTLINNAGFGEHTPFHEASRETQVRMIQLNITSLTELTHLF